LYNIDYII